LGSPVSASSRAWELSASSSRLHAGPEGQHGERRQGEGQDERDGVDHGLRGRLERAHHDGLDDERLDQHDDGVAPGEEARRVEHRPQQEQLRAGAGVAREQVERTDDENGRRRGDHQGPFGRPGGAEPAPDAEQRDREADSERDHGSQTLPGEPGNGQAADEQPQTAGAGEQGQRAGGGDVVAGEDGTPA